MKSPTIIILVLLAATLLAYAQKAPSNLPSGTEFTNDVPYVKDAHERQKLDIAFFKKGKPRPLLIWIHGGAFMTGDKSENHAIWPELMSAGYAVATINYRLSGDARWPAQITDCKAAIRFLRAHAKDYNIAPGRIAVWGSSAGGHLAALVGTSGSARKLDIGEHLDQSSAVSCAVDMFGPIDFEKMPQFTSPTSPEAKMWGRATSEALDLAREACPITYLSKNTPPPAHPPWRLRQRGEHLTKPALRCRHQKSRRDWRLHHSAGRRPLPRGGLGKGAPANPDLLQTPPQQRGVA